ncbi:uncharacterized protein LOC131949850 [Physella acuta]|uniref:uncharacterized protein LOC131949850 n=1 Tax=Physella acuta TaxID=109671 RepID=UPI0027DB1C47|nr:uncharacterized protein LOC131949850 [Physella acuta]
MGFNHLLKMFKYSAATNLYAKANFSSISTGQNFLNNILGIGLAGKTKSSINRCLWNLSGNNNTSELDSFLSKSFLDLEKIDENLFRSKTLWKPKKVARGIYGGQLIGQALIAASHGMPESQHIHSLHSYFLQSGSTDRPILYHVDKTRDGKTYCSRSVKVVQAGSPIFTMQASFKRAESVPKTHQNTMPKVPLPDELLSPIEVLDNLRKQDLISEERHKFGLEWFEGFPMDVRWVDPTSFMYTVPQNPKRSVWIKAHGHIGDNLHQNTHKCCLAYLSDLYILQTALMPLSPIWDKSIFVASLDHSMWFHAPVRSDEWLLYETEAEHIGDGRALCHGRIWDSNGTLVTTVAQEGVMRFNTHCKINGVMSVVQKNNQSPELDSFLTRSFLDLEKIDDNLFRSKSLWKHKLARGVYGGQLIGQSLIAASYGIPENQHIHSLHSYFLQKGNTDLPMLYHVDKTRGGKTYCSRSIKAVQAGSVVFTMQASFKMAESIEKTHQLPMPKVPHPNELKAPPEILSTLRQHDLITEERLRLGLEYFEGFPMDIRWVDPELFLYIRPHYPKRSVWIKSRGHIGDDQHQNVHKCCLSYLSDLYIVQTALLPFAPIWEKPFFVTSLDHCMWFHAPCRADDWLLYEIEAENTGDGRALCHGRIWDTNGTLVTTVSQEGVIRPAVAKL